MRNADEFERAYAAAKQDRQALVNAVRMARNVIASLENAVNDAALALDNIETAAGMVREDGSSEADDGPTHAGPVNAAPITCSVGDCQFTASDAFQLFDETNGRMLLSFPVCCRSQCVAAAKAYVRAGMHFYKLAPL